MPVSLALSVVLLATVSDMKTAAMQVDAGTAQKIASVVMATADLMKAVEAFTSPSMSVQTEPMSVQTEPWLTNDCRTNKREKCALCALDNNKDWNDRGTKCGEFKIVEKCG